MFEFIKNWFKKEPEPYTPDSDKIEKIMWLLNVDEYKNQIFPFLDYCVSYKNFAFYSKETDYGTELPQIYIVDLVNKFKPYQIYETRICYFTDGSNEISYEYKNGEWDFELENCLNELVEISQSEKLKSVKEESNKDQERETHFKNLFKKEN